MATDQIFSMSGAKLQMIGKKNQCVYWAIREDGVLRAYAISELRHEDGAIAVCRVVGKLPKMPESVAKRFVWARSVDYNWPDSIDPISNWDLASRY
jgi:hypothetical protein